MRKWLSPLWPGGARHLRLPASSPDFNCSRIFAGQLARRQRGAANSQLAVAQ